MQLMQVRVLVRVRVAVRAALALPVQTVHTHLVVAAN